MTVQAKQAGNSIAVSLCASALAVAFICSAGAAWASSPLQRSGTTFSTKVEYADIDVHSPQGAQVLIARVRQAAKRVCRAAAPDGPMEGGDIADYVDCVNGATNRAIDRLDVPEVLGSFRETRLAQATPTP
jgi:UrcA family protein